MEIVVDSSVLVAMLVPNDVWHERTVELWAAIEANGHKVIVLDCVAAESISVAVRRLREKGLVADVQLLLDGLDAYIPYDKITWILSTVSGLYPQVLDLIRSRSASLFSCWSRRCSSSTSPLGVPIKKGPAGMVTICGSKGSAACCACGAASTALRVR